MKGAVRLGLLSKRAKYHTRGPVELGTKELKGVYYFWE